MRFFCFLFCFILFYFGGRGWGPSLISSAFSSVILEIWRISSLNIRIINGIIWQPKQRKTQQNGRNCETGVTHTSTLAKQELSFSKKADKRFEKPQWGYFNIFDFGFCTPCVCLAWVDVTSCSTNDSHIFFKVSCKSCWEIIPWFWCTGKCSSCFLTILRVVFHVLIIVNSDIISLEFTVSR